MTVNLSDDDLDKKIVLLMVAAVFTISVLTSLLSKFKKGKITLLQFCLKSLGMFTCKKKSHLLYAYFRQKMTINLDEDDDLDKKIVFVMVGTGITIAYFSLKLSRWCWMNRMMLLDLIRVILAHSNAVNPPTSPTITPPVIEPPTAEMIPATEIEMPPADGPSTIFNCSLM